MRTFLTYLLCLLIASATVLDADAASRRRRKVSKPQTQQSAPRKTPKKTRRADAPRTAKSVKTEKQQTQKEITETRRRLTDNEKQTRKTLDRLTDLRNRIDRQETKIHALNDSISAVSSDIIALDDSIEAMNADTRAIRADLKQALRSMRARRHSVSDIAFVFAAPNFSAALRRVNYIRQLNAWRADKIKRLKKQIDAVNAKKERLEALRARHSGLLSSVNTEKQILASRQSEERKTADRLRGEKNQLNTLLAEKQRRARQLDRELDRIIAEEARRAEEARKAEEARRAAAEAQKKAEAKRAADEKRAAEQKAREEAAGKNKKDKKQDRKQDKKAEPKAETKPNEQKPRKPEVTAAQRQADADRTLSGNFAANRGNLLFPVAGKYAIVGNFGRSKHQDISNIEVNNSGIDISVAPGTHVRSVFDGVVSSIFVMQGYHNIIIVRHGNYLTVYAGVTGVSVKKGATVKAGQTLGTVYSDPDDDNRTVLHFEVRNERQKLNPLDWVR